jgi:hypothetical protein
VNLIYFKDYETDNEREFVKGHCLCVPQKQLFNEDPSARDLLKKRSQEKLAGK